MRAKCFVPSLCALSVLCLQSWTVVATYVWASDWAFSAEEGTLSTPDSIYISAVQDPEAGQSQFSYGAC